MMFQFDSIATNGNYHAIVHLLEPAASVRLVSLAGQIGVSSPKVALDDFTARIMYDYTIDVYTTSDKVLGFPVVFKVEVTRK